MNTNQLGTLVALCLTHGQRVLACKLLKDNMGWDLRTSISFVHRVSIDGPRSWAMFADYITAELEDAS